MVRIKDLRKARGLSQKEIAIDLHVSQATVSAWESGTKKMSNASAAKVADFFDVSMDYLLGRTDADTKNTMQPATDSDDELRTKVIDQISVLSDPALGRVLDFLDGLSAGLSIGATEAVDHDPGASQSQ